MCIRRIDRWVLDRSVLYAHSHTCVCGGGGGGRVVCGVCMRERACMRG